MQTLIEHARVELKDALEREKVAHAVVADEQTLATTAPTTSNRQRRSGNRQNYSTMNNPNSRSVPVAFQADSTLAQALVTASEDVGRKALDLESATSELLKFEEDNLTSYEDFFDLGREAARPIVDDYIRLFLDPDGDYFHLSAAYSAARVLNPLVVSAMSQEQIKDTIKDLKHFKFDEFCPKHGIIERLLREVPSYLAVIESTPESFWTTMEGAERYEMALQKKKQKDPSKYPAQHTWMNDRIEKARRVWEWWKTYHHKVKYFSTAARLVALVQTSSASVERAFSQVKVIVDTVGVNALEDSVQTRVMSRINEY